MTKFLSSGRYVCEELLWELRIEEKCRRSRISLSSLFCWRCMGDGVRTKTKMALLCSAAVRAAPLRLCFYLLFYLLLISIFTHITSALITYDKSALLDIGNRFTNLVQDTLSPNPSWPLEILRNAERTKDTGDGTKNTVEKALGFGTDWGKGLTVLLYRAFCSLMSNPWIIRWTILEPGLVSNGT